MKIKIQSIKFDSTQKLNDYITKKVGKLENHFDEILTVDVFLKVVKPEAATNKEAEIKVTIPSGDFFAAKISDTFEQSIDECIEALEKQITKHKEKNHIK